MYPSPQLVGAVDDSGRDRDWVVVVDLDVHGVEAMVKRHGGATYVFAVGMRGGKARATFAVAGMKGQTKAEVLGEGRTLDVEDGVFHDTFQPWDVHLYKIETWRVGPGLRRGRRRR